MPEEIILELSWVVFHGFLSQMKSNLCEYFTSDAMQHFDLLLHPISPEYGQNKNSQNSQWKNAAIRLSKYVKVKTFFSPV